jgi:hypothetical protein
VLLIHYKLSQREVMGFGCAPFGVQFPTFRKMMSPLSWELRTGRQSKTSQKNWVFVKCAVWKILRSCLWSDDRPIFHVYIYIYIYRFIDSSRCISCNVVTMQRVFCSLFLEDNRRPVDLPALVLHGDFSSLASGGIVDYIRTHTRCSPPAWGPVQYRSPIFALKTTKLFFITRH